MDWRRRRHVALWMRVCVGWVGKEVHDCRIRGILVGVAWTMTGAGAGRVEVIIRLAGALFGQPFRGTARADDIGEQDLV